MLPLLSLHALATKRGDGLRPELLALFERYARSETGLAVIIEAVETQPLCHLADVVPKEPVKQCEADESTANVSCCRASGQ